MSIWSRCENDQKIFEDVIDSFVPLNVKFPSNSLTDTNKSKLLELILCLSSVTSLLGTHSVVTVENIDYILIWRRKALGRCLSVEKSQEVTLETTTKATLPFGHKYTGNSFLYYGLFLHFFEPILTIKDIKSCSIPRSLSKIIRVEEKQTILRFKSIQHRILFWFNREVLIQWYGNFEAHAFASLQSVLSGKHYYKHLSI